MSADYKGKSNSWLKDELKKRNLSSSGTAAKMIDRLVADDRRLASSLQSAEIQQEDASSARVEEQIVSPTVLPIEVSNLTTIPAFELGLYLKASACKGPDIKIRIFQLDLELLTMSNKFDPTVESGLSCVATALLSPKYPDRLDGWITKRLTSDTYVLSKDNYAVFFLKSSSHYESTIHEIVVGLVALNELRIYLPNFQYTYGSLNCPAPQDGYAVCPVSSGNVVPQAILEILDGTETKILREYATYGWSGLDLVNFVVQLVNALYVAYGRYQFKHNNLTLDNIIIQVLEYELSIPIYNSQGILAFLATKSVIRITDFTMASFHLDGKDYHRLNMEGKSDMTSIKEILTLLNPADENAFHIKTYLLDLVTNVSDYEAILYQCLQFSLNPPIFWTEPKVGSVMTACPEGCITWDSYIDHILINKAQPKTLLELHDAETAATTLIKGDKEYIDKIITWLNAIDLDTLYLSDIQRYTSELTNMRTSFLQPDSPVSHDAYVAYKHKLDAITKWRTLVNNYSRPVEFITLDSLYNQVMEQVTSIRKSMGLKMYQYQKILRAV